MRHYALGDDVLGETGASGYTYFGDGHGSTRQLMAGDGSGVAVETVSQREQYYDYDAYGEAFGWELDEPDSGVSRPPGALLTRSLSRLLRRPMTPRPA